MWFYLQKFVMIIREDRPYYVTQSRQTNWKVKFWESVLKTTQMYVLSNYSTFIKVAFLYNILVQSYNRWQMAIKKSTLWK